MNIEQEIKNILYVYLTVSDNLYEGEIRKLENVTLKELMICPNCGSISNAHEPNCEYLEIISQKVNDELTKIYEHCKKNN